MKWGMTRVFSSFLAVVLFITFLPGNVSGKPLDLSGIGEGFAKLAENLRNIIPSIDVSTGGNNLGEVEKIPFQKVVVQVDPDKDTEVKSLSQKIILKVPKGAVANKTEIELIEHDPKGNFGLSIMNNTPMIRIFELKAKDTVSNQSVSKFNQPLEIKINNNPADLAGIDPSSVHLYYYDETAKLWKPIPTGKFDKTTGELVATTFHFSIYGEQGNPNIVGPGRIMASEVNLHAGTATFTYPLELPSGPGGFQPKLELVYNSGSADEMKDKKAVGSWVGIGWSLSLGQIGRDLTTNKYFLDLCRTSYELVTSDSINYHTNPETYFKITRDTGNNKWVVLDREGYYYEFGGTTLSQQYIDNGGNKSFYQWNLNLMKDANGNKGTVTYVQDLRGSYPYEWIRSAYPQYLRYGYVDETTYKMEVVFNTATETDYGGTDGRLRLDNPISYTYYTPFECNPYQCGTYQFVCDQEWVHTGWHCEWGCYPGCDPLEEFCCSPCFYWVEDGYYRDVICEEPIICYETCYFPNTNPAPQVMENRRLSSVEVKVGGTSSTLLRRYDFDYTFTDRVFSGDLGGVYYAGTMKLNSITEKGTDGTSAQPTISFTYSNLTTNYNGNPSFSWPHLTQVNSGYGGIISFSYTHVPTSATTMWSREIVNTKTINSGIGGNETYSYGYLGNVSTGDTNPQYFGTGVSAKYRGFEKVTETDAASNCAHHFFFTTGTIGGKDAEKLTGREYKTEWYNSSSQKLKEDANDWIVYTIGTNWAVRLNKVEETIGDKTTRTEYVYDDYGNVVSDRISGDISTNADDLTVWHTFYPNTTANILSRPACERIYATIITEDTGGGNLRKETLYYYDGNNSSLTTPPTKGMLTRVESKKDASNSVSSYTTYDTFGNVLTTTDPNNNTTTLTWDTTYRTYPATQTFPISGLSESYTYDPGTNNVLISTNVNSQTTSYEYDVFKRLTKVVKPGDTSGSPSIQYQYNNWGTINQQNLKTMTKISEGNYAWQSQYFDGLGRVVQVHSNAEANHTIISGTTTFNSRGLVDKQYVTQDLLSAQVNGYKTPEAGWKYGTSTYDALGRVLVQTSADSTTIRNDYSVPWKMAVTNQRSFITRYYYDAFGRLVKVEEPNESNGIYATTNYTYDILGNLTQVLDNNSNTTTMSYDWLSRKTAMSDPDMGSWSYGYDNNGNLTSQTDAKSQTIAMVYDTMNRLTNKNYPVGSGMTNVVYTYDNVSGGNYGKGLRTGMTDVGGTNSYKYDTRGRLIEEKINISSVDYITGYTYDGLDSTSTVTYPSGETVTNTYNGRVLPNTVSGSIVGNLVSSSFYNQLGAIIEINLGNGVKTTYGYCGTGGTYDTTGGYYGRLWEIKSAKDSTILQDVKHTWDGNGNLTQRLDLVCSETENFTYDSLDRLTGATGVYTHSYTYNTIGNIMTMNGSSYTYSAKPHAVSAFGTASTYTYDNNGNMLTAGSGNKVDTITLTSGGSGYTSTPTVTITGGGGSGATATSTLTPTTVANITVTNSGSGYTSVPAVTLTGGGGSGATATATLTGTSIASLTITNGGSGYTSAPTVTITGGGGSGATATSTLTPRAVGNISVTAGGTNYTSPPTVTISGGGSSGATATASLTAVSVANVTLSNAGSGYTSSPTVSITDGGGSGATAATTLTPSTVASLSLGNGGSGYTSAPSVTISGGSGSGATGTATLAPRAVGSINVTSVGSGYTSAPTVSITGGGGSGATVTAILSATSVVGLAITNGGSGYTSAPTVNITGGGGSGASASATLTPTSLTSLTLTNGGSGYSTAPSVTLSGGGGSGATATAVLAGKSVASVAVTDQGHNYDSAPTVVFTGGGGSGAAATATVVNKKVTAVTVINGGSGYTSAPSVSFTGGGGSGAQANASLSTTSVASLNLTNAGSGYTSSPTVNISGGGGSGAAATANLTATSVANLNLTNGGSGYTSAPNVEITSGGGTGATGTATLNTRSVSSIQVNNGGSGYTSVPTVGISGGSGSGAAAEAVLGPAAVANVNLTNGGTGYTSTPSVSFSGGGGSGAQASANLTPTSVATLNLTNGGSGYTSTPTLAITGGGGSGATGTATLQNQSVATINVTNGGSGYTSVPTVDISGGGGSGAVASAVLAPAAVGNLTVTNGGSGYTTAPTVSFDGGAGSGATATANLAATSIATINVTNAGSGYTSAPTVGISGGSGSGAAATANLTGTSVGSLTLVTGGSFYTQAPAVVFSGGNGTGAAATTTIVSATKTFGWDVENRLVSVTLGQTVIAEFVYDGDGNRIKKTESGETILYINQYYEKNLTTGVVTTSYYLGGKLVANRVGTTLTYLHLDHLESTSVAIDSSGCQTESIKYFPFGFTRSGSISTDKKFTGQRLDATGLYYYGARYYDPTIGRFISPDTAMPDLMNPQSLNKYSYCFNNPLKYTDPTGHWPKWLKNIGQSITNATQVVVNFVKENVDKIQMGLDAAGMIPVIGEICDVASGIISAAKGDWVGAGLSFASVVPVVGNVSGGAKIARNVIKIVDKADDIADVTKTVNKAEGFIGSYKEVKAAIKASGEKGLEVHHIVEKRFAKPLGLEAGNMPSIALKKSDHQTFTRDWRTEITYGTSKRTTVESVWNAAQRVYRDNPILRQASSGFLFE